jgi:hypothetical protein
MPRVSTDGQTLDTQRGKLTEEGAEKIFAEKESGAKAGEVVTTGFDSLRPLHRPLCLTRDAAGGSVFPLHEWPKGNQMVA